MKKSCNQVHFPEDHVYDCSRPSRRVALSRNFVLGALCFALVLLSGSVPITQATQGDLDPTFGNGGRVVTDFSGTDYLSRIAVQPDGKIIAVGSSNNKFALLRYNPDGTLDQTFGNGGKVTSVIANVNENASGLVLLPDGKMMISGSIDLPRTTDSSFALLRYNANGSLDTSFGNGGIVTTNVGPDSDQGIRIGRQPDGKLVVAGRKGIQFYPTEQRKGNVALARYNPDGSLDATFGNGGIVISDFGGGLESFAITLIIQPNGRIIVAGESGYRFLVGRYNSNGTLDTTFGNGGYVTTNFSSNWDSGKDAVLQADGKIILIGTAEVNSPDYNLALARYNSDGSLDSSFGSGGKILMPTTGRFSAAVLQGDGKLIALATSSSQFLLLRFNTNGSLDSTFGNAGTVATSFAGGSAESRHLVLQPDGKLLAAGFSPGGPYYQNSDFVISRYLVSSSSAPTAGSATIQGQVSAADGRPLSGSVINLSGAQNRRTITDANGIYHFDNVPTSGFYTVTPSRANYTFNPFNRSFSQTGNSTEALFTGAMQDDHANPLDTPEYFVRQQYVDVLDREPDEGGFNYWSDQILACNADASCVNRKRREVAAAFFIAPEFQQSGAFIYDLYAATLNRKLTFDEYSSDRRQVVGGATLDSAKLALARSFVQRAEFVNRYPDTMTAETFVDALIRSIQSSGVDLISERGNLISTYNLGSDLVASRASVVSAIADNATFKQAEYNKAFVLTEYFSYLRRDPDQPGYDFWVNVLSNGEPGNYLGMVCSFITSTEYQLRFGSTVTRSNADCGQ